MFERELGCVHAEDDETLRAVARVPRFQVWKRAQAVDARVGPEVDEDNLAPELREAERTRVDPGRDVVNVRRGAVVLQRHLAEARCQLLPARDKRRDGLAAEPGQP